VLFTVVESFTFEPLTIYGEDVVRFFVILPFAEFQTRLSGIYGANNTFVPSCSGTQSVWGSYFKLV
jgi:hypothetical protein